MKLSDKISYVLLGVNSGFLMTTGILGALGCGNVPQPGLRMILGSSLAFIAFLLASQRRER